MKKLLYEADGPACAVLLGGGWSLRICPVCKTELSIQTGNFSTELICSPPRQVWLPGSPEVFVSEQIIAILKEKNTIGFFSQPVTSQWYAEESYKEWGRPPTLFQIRSNLLIHATPQSLSYEECALHPTRILEPLTVFAPSDWSEYGVWQLAEHPRRLLFTQAVRDIMLSYDSDLEFTEISCEE